MKTFVVRVFLHFFLSKEFLKYVVNVLIKYI